MAWDSSVVGGASRIGGGPTWIQSNAPADWSMPLEMRGHGVAIDPRHEQVVLVARRPGNLLWIRDLVKQRVQTIQAPSYRHYLGHAVFDGTGRYLYVTENVYGDYDPVLPITELMRESVVGVYDRDQGYRRVREIPAHGIGSHELRWMPDGQTLVIANGGIYTHPQEEREMLNPDHLAPSLVYVDARDGSLVEKVEPDNPKLSLRHLAVAPSGRVTVGLQYQGKMQDKVPLIASHQRSGVLEYWSLPEPLRLRMKQYTASVEIDPGTGHSAVSAPKAGAVLLFDRKGQLLALHDLPDAAGLGISEQGFVVSSGTGVLELLAAQDLHKLSTRVFAQVAWDNHLAVWS